MIEKYKLVTSNYQTACDMLKTMLSTSAEIELNARPWSRHRSLTASAQVQVWYGDIAEQMGEDKNEIEKFCKLTFGVPILLDDPKYGKQLLFTLNKVGFWDWTHEQQKNMMPILSVTRLFNTKQHNRYRDNMQAYFIKQGLRVEYKEC